MIKPKADLNVTNPKSLKLPEIFGQTTAQAIAVAALAPEVCSKGALQKMTIEPL